MSGHRYIKSTNPFDNDYDDDIDDETFLQNSRRQPSSSQSNFDSQVLALKVLVNLLFLFYNFSNPH